MSDTIIAAIITGAISLIVGFFGGRCYEIRKRQTFKQQAGNNSTQIQVGEIRHGDKNRK